MNASDPKLLVLDWDGTVVDSVGRILGCFSEACADIGRPVPPAPTMRGVIGLGLPQTARVFFPDDPPLWDRFVTAYRDRWLAPGRPLARPFEGAASTLQTLRARGWMLAVATGKSRRGLDRELDETGLRELFSATRCADETRSKPHPQMLRDVLSRVGVPASRAAMVGDTVHDLEMAQAARVRAVAVTYGVQTWEELRVCGPAHRIDVVTDLLDLFP